MSDAFIRFDRVKKVYQAGEVAVTALHDASFEIEKGEICVIVGESGAGKTTLLNILGGMDSLTDGSVYVDGREISALGKKELTAYRRTEVGFVFQFYNLIPNLTALENVEIAAKLSRRALNAKTVLAEVGLKDRAGNFPAQLSGGEQQRVAIARALAKNPKLLLCDEPTGALDYNTSKDILQLIETVNRRYGTTVIIVTHNAAIAGMADRVIRLRDGAIRGNERNAAKIAAAELEW
jgi:putative ABC transport system ATP-binding protein